MRKRILAILLNPYVLSITIFLVWMTFFDRYSYMNLREIRAQVAESKEELQWYTEQIEEVRKHFLFPVLIGSNCVARQ